MGSLLWSYTRHTCASVSSSVAPPTTDRDVTYSEPPLSVTWRAGVREARCEKQCEQRVGEWGCHPLRAEPVGLKPEGPNDQIALTR